MPEHVLLAIKKFFICLSGEFLSHSLLKKLSLFVSFLSHTQPDQLNKTEFYIHSRQGFLPKFVPPFSPPTHFLIYRTVMKTQKIWGLWGDRWTRYRGKYYKWCCEGMAFTGKREHISAKVRGIFLFLFHFSKARHFNFMRRLRSWVLDVPENYLPWFVAFVCLGFYEQWGFVLQLILCAEISFVWMWLPDTWWTLTPHRAEWGGCWLQIVPGALLRRRTLQSCWC